MTLGDARQGDRLLIEPAAGLGIQRRLWDLGILPGSTVAVLACHPFGGPIVVVADGVQVAVGRSLAAMIPVSKAARSQHGRRGHHGQQDRSDPGPAPR